MTPHSAAPPLHAPGCKRRTWQQPQLFSPREGRGEVIREAASERPEIDLIADRFHGPERTVPGLEEVRIQHATLGQLRQLLLLLLLLLARRGITWRGFLVADLDPDGVSRA